MPSLRVGCDLCEIAAMEQLLADRDGGLEKLFDPEEHRYAMAHAHPAQHLAGIFAAKEALAKAVRSPGVLGTFHREVVVTHLEDGSPSLRCSEVLQGTLQRLGVRVLDCSISHDGAYAMATVLVEATQHDTPGTRRCDRCLLTLESLATRGICDVLVRVEHADGTSRYLCPVCVRGW